MYHEVHSQSATKKMQSLILTFHPLKIDSVPFVLSFAIEVLLKTFVLLKIHWGLISNCRSGYWSINKTWTYVFFDTNSKVLQSIKKSHTESDNVESNRQIPGTLGQTISGLAKYLFDIYSGCKLCGFFCLFAIW